MRRKGQQPLPQGLFDMRDSNTKESSLKFHSSVELAAFPCWGALWVLRLASLETAETHSSAHSGAKRAPRPRVNLRGPLHQESLSLPPFATNK